MLSGGGRRGRVEAGAQSQRGVANLGSFYWTWLGSRPDFSDAYDVHLVRASSPSPEREETRLLVRCVCVV